MSVLAWTRNAGLALIFVALGLGLSPAAAQTSPFFRIGTGGTAGTYFPIGGLIANAISNPPGSRACADGGSCGVPDLVAVVLATNASVANIEALQAGRIEAGFSQSDVAHWAYSGTGVFEGRGKVADLRAIANLYRETVHLVARKGAGISSVADLRGKRVALDDPGSGTLIDAWIILAGHGLTENDIEASFLKPDVAGQKLRAGELDAFFFIGGSPVEAIAELASSAGIELVPIAGPQADKILADYPFFARDRVPAAAYKDVPETSTLSVNAVLVTHARQSDELIYAITEALWNENTRRLLDGGHSKGRMIRKETATQGLGLPLHPGAERFYRDIGLLAGAR
jgi:TRAP transporter TAXI family solute receptor